MTTPEPEHEYFYSYFRHQERTKLPKGATETCFAGTMLRLHTNMAGKVLNGITEILVFEKMLVELFFLSQAPI